MQKMIEFKNLNVNTVVQIWEPEFEVTDWIRGYRERLVNEEQRVSIVEKMQIVILVVCIFIALLIAMWIGSKKFEKVKKMLEKTIKTTFWNGLILSFQMECMVFCIVVGNQIRLTAMKSPYAIESEQDAAIGMFCYINAVAVLMISFLVLKKDKLYEKELQERCGNLYSLSKGNKSVLPLLRVPFSIIHRQLYMVFASAFYAHPYFSLQAFVFFNLMFTMYRINYKLNAPMIKRF